VLLISGDFKFLEEMCARDDAAIASIHGRSRNSNLANDHAVVQSSIMRKAWHLVIAADEIAFSKGMCLNFKVAHDHAVLDRF